MKNQSKYMLIVCSSLREFRMDSYAGFSLLTLSILALGAFSDRWYFWTVHISMLVDA